MPIFPLPKAKRPVWSCQNDFLTIYIQGVPKKLTFSLLLEPRCTGSITSGWHHLSLESVFCRFLLRLSRITRLQVMSMVKFSPIALNFGYDFILLVHFFGTPCSGWKLYWWRQKNNDLEFADQMVKSLARKSCWTWNWIGVSWVGLGKSLQRRGGGAGRGGVGASERRACSPLGQWPIRCLSAWTRELSVPLSRHLPCIAPLQEETLLPQSNL